MTLNDLIRDAQAIASQFSGGDIPLVQDVSLEVLRAGSTYAVGAFVANQLTWEDIQIIREEMFKSALSSAMYFIKALRESSSGLIKLI